MQEVKMVQMFELEQIEVRYGIFLRMPETTFILSLFLFLFFWLTSYEGGHHLLYFFSKAIIQNGGEHNLELYNI